MKSDFLLAVTQLSAEKGLPKEVVLGAVEAALASAYRKSNFTLTQKVVVKISPTTGKVEVWAEKTVVEQPEDSRTDISLEEARRVNDKIEVGDILMVESTPQNAGRIAAQTAKQVILQRLHEAEHSAILEEYTGREGEIINGTIQRVESGQIIVDLGRTEAILPASEQVRNERYRIGQRLKAYLLEVARTIKGPRVVLSRSHPEFIRCLFELEIPEVLSGVVEIKARPSWGIMQGVLASGGGFGHNRGLEGDPKFPQFGGVNTPGIMKPNCTENVGGTPLLKYIKTRVEKI